MKFPEKQTPFLEKGQNWFESFLIFLAFLLVSLALWKLLGPVLILEYQKILFYPN